MGAASAIEQGPLELRLLAQGAAAASCLNSAMVCVGFPRVRGMLPSLVAVCQAAFAIIALAFELAFQDFLWDQKHFLAGVGTRSLFYFLQGFLWFPFASCEEPQHLVIGIWLSVVGIFHVCTYYDWMPRRTLAKAASQR